MLLYGYFEMIELVTRMGFSIQHVMKNLIRRLRVTLQKACVTALPVQLWKSIIKLLYVPVVAELG